MALVNSQVAIVHVATKKACPLILGKDVIMSRVQIGMVGVSAVILAQVAVPNTNLHNLRPQVVLLGMLVSARVSPWPLANGPFQLGICLRMSKAVSSPDMYSILCCMV